MIVVLDVAAGVGFLLLVAWLFRRWRRESDAKMRDY